MYTNVRGPIEEVEDVILDSLENDDYGVLRALAAETEDEVEAAELRRMASVAYNNCWSYDEMMCN